MGAMMTATLEYQRVMAGQLASLQEGMAEVLTKLSALPKEFQALLHHDRLTQLHARLGREVLRYQHEATVRAGTFGSYQSWSADQLTRDEMTDVSRLVSDTVTEIKRGRWLDALTALYLPASVTDRRNRATDVRRIGASNRWVERASRGVTPGWILKAFEGLVWWPARSVSAPGTTARPAPGSRRCGAAGPGWRWPAAGWPGRPGPTR